MNFVSVISCVQHQWPLTVFASLSTIYNLLLLRIQFPVLILFLFVHTVNSTTTHIHHTGPTAQINVDVVNFKEYIYIQIRVAKHIVPSTVSIVSGYNYT